MKRFTFAIAAIAIAALAIGCSTQSTTTDTQASREAQAEIGQRAFEAVPPELPDQFPRREAINWYVGEISQTREWYVYLLAMTGEPIFYAVSSIQPQCLGTTITAPERVIWNGSGSRSNAVVTAPTMSGTYPSDSCSAYFFRDASTGALIEMTTSVATVFYSTVPLSIETDLLSGVVEEEAEE